MDDLNIAVIIAQFINFGIVFFIFYYFLGKTIVKTIEERRTQIENLGNSDDKVREKLEAADQEAKKIILEGKNKALEIQNSAEELSKINTEKAIKDAKNKAEGIVDSAKRDLEKERLGMLDSMKKKVLDLSLKINSKVFDKKENNKDFISKEVNSIKL